MNFVDRQAEFQNRKKMTPVPGQPDIFDMTGACGTVIEAGTPLDAVNLSKLNPNCMRYDCNGEYDNIALSELSYAFFGGYGDYADLEDDASLYVYVVGNVGITSNHYSGFSEFVFGLNNYQGNKKLYFNWDNANFAYRQKDLSELYTNGNINSAHYIMFDNIGEGYIEHRGVNIELTLTTSSETVPANNSYYDLEYSVFSGSHGKYINCNCMLYNSINHSGSEYIYTDRYFSYTEDTKVFNGSFNDYEGCKGIVYCCASTNINITASLTANHCGVFTESFCCAFQGSNNMYNECEGFAHGYSFAYMNADCSSSITAYAYAAGAWNVPNSEFHNGTFAGLSEYDGDNGSDSGGYGIESYGGNNDYHIIENCKFPLTAFYDWWLNYNAMPISVSSGSGSIKNNIFSDQLQSSYWSGQIFSSGNITTAISRNIGWFSNE